MPDQEIEGLILPLFDGFPNTRRLATAQKISSTGLIMKLSNLETFAEALKAKFSLPGSASPEDQLKPVVADLLKSAGKDYGLTVDTRTETHLSDHKCDLILPSMSAG